MIRLLVYTNAPVVLAGLRTLLSNTDDIELMHSCSIEGCIAGARELAPDVVLIEMDPGIDIGTVVATRRQNPSARIILWIQTISVDMAHALREVGVAGILRKDVPVDLMFRCIRKVALGEAWFDRSLLSDLLNARKVTLSPRERQLLTLISRGRSNESIASELAIAEGTVKVYLSKLFKKVGVSDRFELALYGLRAMAVISQDATGPGVWSPCVLANNAAALLQARL